MVVGCRLTYWIEDIALRPQGRAARSFPPLAVNKIWSSENSFFAKLLDEQVVKHCAMFVAI